MIEEGPLKGKSKQEKGKSEAGKFFQSSPAVKRGIHFLLLPFYFDLFLIPTP
jgi:hypothetical protein